MYGRATPKDSQIKAIRGKISALAMWLQFQVRR